MNRFPSPALLASLALVAGTAMAQNTQDKTGTAASKGQTQTLDDNAQRQHSRDQGGAAAASKDSAATGSGSAATGSGSAGTASNSGQQATAQGGTRNWAQIDANHDNLVSPEEMEAGLKQGGSASSAKSSSTSGNK